MTAFIIGILFSVIFGSISFVIAKIVLKVLIVFVVVISVIYYITYEALSTIPGIGDPALISGTFAFGSLFIWLIYIATNKTGNDKAGYSKTNVFMRLPESKLWQAISIPLGKAMGFLFMTSLVMMFIGAAGACFYFAYTGIVLLYSDFENDIGGKLFLIVCAFVGGLASSWVLISSFITYFVKK